MTSKITLLEELTRKQAPKKTSVGTFVDNFSRLELSQEEIRSRARREKLRQLERDMYEGNQTREKCNGM